MHRRGVRQRRPGASLTRAVNGVQALLSHPPQWQQLAREPELLPGALRELLRFDSPVQYTARRVATDLVFHGQQLRRGDLVLPLIGAACRDPARYAQPDTLDITRSQGSSLAFGSGPHVCIGAALTLIEAQMVFGQLLKRWPGLSLVDAAPRWGDKPAYRGLVTLALHTGQAPERCQRPADFWHQPISGSRNHVNQIEPRKHDRRRGEEPATSSGSTD